jgi:hypothetical protein
MRNSRRSNRNRRNRTGFSGLTNTPASNLRYEAGGTIAVANTATHVWSALPAYNVADVARISSVDIEAVAAAPTRIQVGLHDSSGVARTETRSMLIGDIPVRFKVSMPKSTDFGFMANVTAWTLANLGSTALEYTYVLNYCIKSSS